MFRLLALPLSFGLLAATLWIGATPSFRNASTQAEKRTFVAPAEARPAPAVCFAPGTPEEYVREWQTRIWRGALDYQIGERWQYTATDGNTGGQGDGVTITYSFIPDGTMIDGRPSQLWSMLNSEFGSPEVWQAVFAEVFRRWSEVSGLRYVPTVDDGATWVDAPGVLGVRGDVRIGSVPVDGGSGVLAYNYYPDLGDMVLDASEDWGSTARDHIFMRNIVAHEHGHGWGLAHVCPVNSTKLLEPYYSSSFDGPQHDDIRAVQRNYGDTYEPNNDASHAARLGVIGADTTLDEVSVDDDSDQDYWKFSVPGGKAFSLRLVPVGEAYLDGPQNGDGSCTAGNEINSGDDLNLDLTLYNATGAVILAQANTRPVGQAEVIARYAVNLAGDSFIVKVTGGGSNTLQLYRLEYDVYYLHDPHLSQTAFAFDTTRQGTPLSSTTWLINNAPSPLNVTGLTVDGGHFAVAPEAPRTVAVGDSLQLTVTYLADTPDEHESTLRIEHSGPGGFLEVPLSGTTVSSWLEFAVSPNQNFGDVPVGAIDSLRVPVRARGNVPLTITALDVSAPFSIGQTAPIYLLPTQALFLRPRFAPAEAGEYNGMLVITHDGYTSPDTMFLHGTATATAAGEPDAGLPAVFRLAQNYPNPFNPATTIAFDLPRAAEVRLEVYDVQGRLVSSLVRGNLEVGHHMVEFSGRDLPSGMYLYRLTAPGFSQTNKMMLMK